MCNVELNKLLHYFFSGIAILCSIAADLFLYLYQRDVLDSLIRSGHRRLSRSFDQ